MTAGGRAVPLAALAAAGLLAAAAPCRAQDPAALHLVVPAPPAESVIVLKDRRVEASGPGGRLFDLYRPRAAAPASRLPVVVFANAGNPMRAWTPYVEWSRLVTRRGLAAVLYDAERPTADADLRALLAALRRDGAALGVDADNVVLWASSSNAATATPVALDSASRQVRALVLYYGEGDAPAPRLDLPVLVVRSGLDAPELNRRIDSLTARLVAAGAPVTLVTHPAGRHGFDWFDRTAMSAAIIEATLAFMRGAVTPALRDAIAGGELDARAGVALAAERWAEAAALLERLAAARPGDGLVALKLGYARAGGGEYARALAEFDRAKALGVRGARDLGVPAVRAALRAGDRRRAVEWLGWTVQAMPPHLRPQLRADREIAPLLDDPAIVRLLRPDAPEAP